MRSPFFKKFVKIRFRTTLICVLVICGAVAFALLWHSQKSPEQRAAEAEAKKFKEMAEEKQSLTEIYEEMAAEAKDDDQRKRFKELAKKAKEEAKKYESMFQKKMREGKLIAVKLKRGKIQKKIERLESLITKAEEQKSKIKKQILDKNGDQTKLLARYDKLAKELIRLKNDLRKTQGLIKKDDWENSGKTKSPKRHGWGSNDAIVEASAAVPIKIAKVKRDNINTYLLTTTTLEPEKQVDIVAKISGEVTDLSVEVGDRVKAKQILAKIDEEETRLNLESAKVKYENADREYQRAKRTYETGIISDEELQDKKLAYDTAKVQYDQAKLNFEYSRVRSTIDGIVVSRNIEFGDFVNANRVIFTVADCDPILARIHIPEKDVLKVKLGDTARIVAESTPDKEFEGKVRLLGPIVDPESGTVKVEIEIREGTPQSETSQNNDQSNDNLCLRPGTFASVYIITDKHENALVIPKDALLLESEFDEVYVVRNLVKMSVPAEQAKLIKAGDIVKLVMEDSDRNELSAQKENGALTKEPAQMEWKGEVYEVSETSKGYGRTGAETPNANVIIRMEGEGQFLQSGTSVSALVYANEEANSGPTGNAEPNSSNLSSPLLGSSASSVIQIATQPIEIQTRAFKTRVKLGFSEGANVEILDGLKLDDRIVIVGQDDLQQGAIVNIIEESGG